MGKAEVGIDARLGETEPVGGIVTSGRAARAPDIAAVVCTVLADWQEAGARHTAIGQRSAGYGLRVVRGTTLRAEEGDRMHAFQVPQHTVAGLDGECGWRERGQREPLV